MNSTQQTPPDPNTAAEPLTIIVMGVSGCGKSTVASLIADGLAVRGLSVHNKDADELHPASNIDKMSAGIPLTDADRQPWLETLVDYARQHARQHGICVMACSALKRCYRSTISSAGNVVYVYLHGSKNLIASRMHKRTGHFMPESMLNSQFATLEDPRDEPQVVTVSIEPTPDIIASNAISLLEKHGAITLISQ